MEMDKEPKADHKSSQSILNIMVKTQGETDCNTCDFTMVQERFHLS